MKNSTQNIYNIITTDNFIDIKEKLEDKVNRHNWKIPEYQEYTYEELLRDLPDYIDIVKQNIDDGIFDTLPYNWRNSIHQTVNQLNQHLQNIYNNSQQFANLLQYTQALITQVRTYNLNFTARNVPRYREKIKEYQELIEILDDLNNTYKTTVQQNKELTEFLQKAEDVVEDINIYLNRAEEKEADIEQRLESSKETNNQINALLETIKEHRENIVELLQESKSSNSNIKDTENEITKFHSKIEAQQKKMEEFIVSVENTINNFSSQTNDIVQKNIKQQEEIENQLNKAVGASLFSTFDVRKNTLNDTLNNWLWALIISIVVLTGLSGWIAYEIMSAEVNWYKVVVKVGISLPLIYTVIFLSNRYTKERRLVEEYAFKSTISLALTPYADLVKKIEDEGSDSKYRDFLISSIDNIFSVPTDKAFGVNMTKETNIGTKNLNELLDVITKATNIKGG
jgi:predicted  nucleic acid-binding Zn-ribbon protein